MQTGSSNIDPMSGANRDATRKNLLRKIRNNEPVVLESFLMTLRDHGFRPPGLDEIYKVIGWKLEPRKLREVRFGWEDMFTMLNHLFGNRLSAASRSSQIQYLPPFDVGVDQNGATEMAWHVPYVGSTARLLRKAMDQMNTRRGLANCANFLPIIQSSGMGKSRAVDEVARQVFTLPFNLQRGLDKGHPNGKLEVLDWLSPQELLASQLHVRHCIFFEQLFRTVYEVLKDWPVYDSQEGLAEAFRSWLLDGREPLYKEVGHKCHARLRYSGFYWLPDPPEWKAAEALIQLIQEKSGLQLGDRPAPRSDAKTGTTRRVWLHVYFDEAHNLTYNSTWTESKPRYDGTPTEVERLRTGYHALCSFLDRFRTLDLFIVFLSTSSSISTCPPRSLHLSNRADNERAPGVQVPFCELAFDQWRNQYLLSEGKHTLESVCETTFMIRFGRPLFWTRYDNGYFDARSNILSFARMELAGRQDDKLDDGGRLAVLGIRIGLEFDKCMEAREMEDRLVQGHMRVVFSVPEHRKHVHADYLSEPILAEAGAQLMHINQMWDTFPPLLFNWCGSGLISTGERGELLARLLLTKAHDHVVRLTSPAPRPPPVFTRPILLPDFLEALVGTEHKDKILNAKPNNMLDGPTLADSTLGKARLNFTHWAKAVDGGVLTDETMWVGLGRCLAWECLDPELEVDFVTPLMLPSEDTKLGRYTVSAIFWQIRNRLIDPQVDIDAERLKFFSPYSTNQKTSNSVTAEDANSRPYLTVVLNLGARVTESEVARTKAKFPLSTSSTKRAPNRKGKESPEPVHPRYSITISGCSHKTFPPLVPESEEYLYASLVLPENHAAERARISRAAIIKSRLVWGPLGSYDQAERQESTRPGFIPPQDRLTEAVEIHEFESGAGSCREEAGEGPEDVVGVGGGGT